jgi:membrane protease YdiL (CAAX protease family)
MKMVPTRLTTVSGFLVLLLIPLATWFSRSQTGSIESAFLWEIGTAWAITVLLLVVVLGAERQPLASIGIRLVGWRDLGWAMGGFVVGVVTFMITGPIVQALGLGDVGGGIDFLAQLPVWARLGIAVTAGVTEEVLFRGFLIERLYALTGHLGLAGAISYAIFVLLHLPFWGMGGTIQIGVWSLLVTYLYVKRRNLPACILMHTLNDAFAFIIVPILMTLPPL